MLAVGDDGECTCHHPRVAHEHYRRGTDCALCECRRYRSASAGVVRRILGRVRRS